MKKITFFLIAILFLTACELDNTPTGQVEGFLNKYQIFDDDIKNDLKDALNKDESLTDEMKNEYYEFMKKHYRDLTYEIKDETVDGKSATVTTEITVRDYSSVVTNATAYRLDNPEDFQNENGEYDASLFTKYRLDKLKEVKDTVTYTIEFNLTEKNGEWTLEQLDKEDLNKINGLYVS